MDTMKIRVAFSCCALIVFFCARAIAQVNVSASIPSMCGNGVVDSGEQCDGSNLNGQSCASQGLKGGTLSCNADCTFDTTQCMSGSSAPPPSTGGGGSSGGGGGSSISAPVAVSTQASVTLSGSAYPMSTVTILQDAQIAVQSIAGPGGNFTATINNLSAGSYMFSVYSQDENGNRSSLFTFPVALTTGASTQISGIFISPTIATDKQEVKRGDTLVIFGESAPNAQVTITVHSADPIYAQTSSTKEGAYVYDLNTSQLDLGSHLATAQAAVANLVSDDSVSRSFTVGDTDITAQPSSTVPLVGDFQNNGRVDLVDFSILAFWYNKPNPPAEYRLDGGKTVNLRDFSIMAYYWTG